ncbi:MAG: PAS domain-containing protein [Kangiellaceae bacterium]|nr:PAS domain-containing protein [Kangiellaceae bacterium]
MSKTHKHALYQKYKPICSAISNLFPGIVEVVLHDLTTQKIVHIENPFSNRTPGDDSLINMNELGADANKSDVLGPYKKIHIDGTKLKSISSIVRDDNQKPVALLCINLKTDVFSEASNLLASLINLPNEQASSSPDSLFSEDWREQVNVTVKTVLKERNINLVAAKRVDRQVIIAALNNIGIFEIRGSTDYVANALGISRANLYQILKQTKNRV